MISKDFRGSVREKFLLEVSNLILIGFIFAYLTTENCLQLLLFISIVLLFQVKNRGIPQINMSIEYKIYFI